MSSFEVARADIEWNANTGVTITELGQLGEVYNRTTGGMSEDALRASLAQDKLSRAIQRSGPESIAAKQATITYRNEMRALAAAANEAAAAETKQAEAARASAAASRTAGRSNLGRDERQASQLLRGSFKGAGALGGLGFASLAGGAFVGGYIATSAIRAVLDAAKNEEVALGQLQVALHDTGLSWGKYGGQVEAGLEAQIKATGFTKEDLTAALAANVRRFGDVGKALEANAVDADLARAKNISLAQAQTLVQRASFGNTLALRRLGIDLPKTTANMDALKASTSHASKAQIDAAKAADQQANELAALDAVNARYHGNAAKFLTTTAGKEALYNAELKQSEAIIGQALLPTFDRLLTDLATWLDRMNKSGRLQHDVNTAVHDGALLFHLLGLAITPVVEGFRILEKVAGGTENALELIGGAVVLARLSSTGGAVAAIGSDAVIATGEVEALETGLLGLGGSAVMGRLAALGLSLSGLSKTLAFFGAELPALPDILKVLNGQDPFSTGQSKSRLSPAAQSLVYGRNGVFSDQLYKLTKSNRDAVLASHYGYDNAYDVITAYNNGKISKQLFEQFTKQLFAQDPELAKAALGQAPTKWDFSTSGAGGQPVSRPVVRGIDTPNRFQPNATPLKPTVRKPGAPILGLTQKQLTPLYKAEGTPGTADDLAELRKELAIFNRLLGQKGLTPAQLNSLLQQRNTVTDQIASILSQDASTAKTRSDKAAAAAKKAAAARKKARDALVKSLEQAPVQLRIQEQTAIANGASETKVLAILREERAAIEKQVVELQKIGAGKDAILKARTNEATIQKKIDAITKAKAASGSAIRDEFLSSFRDIVTKYAPNAFPPPATGKTDTHLYDLVHATRKSNEHLARIAKAGAFPASGYAQIAADAVAG